MGNGLWLEWRLSDDILGNLGLRTEEDRRLLRNDRDKNLENFEPR